MLNRFRQGGLVQFLMGGVVVLIIAAFTLDVRRGAAIDTQCAVEVSDECVAPRDFNSAYRLFVNPEWTPQQLSRWGIRQMILDGLVERELLLAEADRLGISVSEEELDRELALGRFHFSMPVERDGQLRRLQYVPVRDPRTDKFNYKIYERSVKNYAHMSTKDFKNNQKLEVTAERVRELIKTHVRISDEEAFAHFRDSRSKATVRVAQLSSSWFSRFATQPSDSDVDAYAAEHQPEVDAAFDAAKERFVEGCPLVSEILFSYPPAADESDETKTRELAERVAKQARSGDAAAFSLLARQHSSAPSASHGGLRGCLHESEGEETKELIAGVADVKPGQVSQLLSFPHGLYLLRLERRLGADEIESVAKRSVARTLLAASEGRRLTQAFARSLMEAVTGGQAMQTAIADLTRAALEEAGASEAMTQAALASRERPQVEVSASFSRVGVINPIPNAKPGVAAQQLAFTLKNVGDVYPEPIETVSGLAVLQLKEQDLATREAFEEEEASVIREFKQQAQRDALVAYVSQLRKSAEDRITINPRFLDAPKSDDS